MPLDGVVRVMRASRRVTAGRRQARSDRGLVHPDQAHQQAAWHELHGYDAPRCPDGCVHYSRLRARLRTLSSAVQSSAQDAVALAGLAATTTSERSGKDAKRCVRASRSRRRTRLRTTALPTRPLTVIPTRVQPSSFGAMYTTSIGCGQPRCATSRTRRKSAGERSRCSRFTLDQSGAAHAAPRSDDGETLAPAQAASLEHRATGSGQHAFEKAVLPPTWDALRLVGTLGHAA
jgi:hypothetical protein